LLLYATGGLAYGGTRSSTSIANLRSNGFQTPGFSSGAFSDTRVGYTVGGGAEWMLREHWSLKAEYLYYDLGTVNYALGALSNSLVAGGTLYTSVAPNASTRFNGNIARLGINYHF
jgi:outer membrane immunogenic protein